MHSLYIVGAGGFGREVLSWLRDCPAWDCEWRFAGFVDDNLGALAGKGGGASVVATLADFTPGPGDLVVCAIGNPATRLRICRELAKLNATFYQLVHPSATVGDNCVFGNGCILCPGVVVTANVRLGDFVVLNVHSSVGHDAVLGDGVTVSGHTDITGCVEIGEGVFLGSHASVLPNAKVGAHAKIGAGSVVLRSVKSGVTVMGVPARQLLP